MAIFKKHKKDQNGSASNRADAIGSPPLHSSTTATTASPGHPAPPKPHSLNGSMGRSGIPVPGPSLYASNGSLANSAGPTAPPTSSASILPQQGATAYQQPPPAVQPSSHTVLYPWSQRHVSLLPSQLLPPSSPVDSPAQPLTPLLGPPSPLPFPRYGHSVNPVATASPSGDLYIFGGLVQNAVKNDLFVVHAAAAGAPPVAPAPAPSGAPASASTVVPLPVALIETRGEVPGPRVGHASVGVGNVLIVWGGDTKSRPEERQDDGLYLLNLSTRDWTRVKTVGRAPEGRYGHAAAMVGSRFFVFGGQTDDGGFRNDLCWFDLQKLKMGQPSWSLYIFGGTDGQYHYNDTWQYDLSSGEWTELACIGYIPVPREGHAATLVDDVMYVFGGRGVDGKDLDDLAAFKISNHRWFMFQNMGPAPSGRSGHAMATYGSKVLVLGGESYTSTKADDPAFIHVLDTTKIKYPPDSARPAPAPPAAPKLSHHPQQAMQQQQFPRAQQQQQQLSSPPLQPLSSSAPPSSGGAPLPPTSQQQQQPAQAGPVKRKSSIPAPGFASGSRSAGAGGSSSDSDARARAASASPTGSQRGEYRNLKSSSSLPAVAAAAAAAGGAGALGAAMLNGGSSPSPPPPGPAPGSPTAYNTPSSPRRDRAGAQGPQRPARPDDAPAFTAGVVPAAPSSPSKSSRREREQREREASVGSASTAHTGGVVDPQRQQQPQGASPQIPAPADAFYYRAPAPSSVNGQPQLGGSVENGAAGGEGDLSPADRALPASQDGHLPVPAPAPAAASSSSPHHAEQLARLERREGWLREALRRAEQQGFVLVPQEGERNDAGDEEREALRSVGAGEGEGDERERRVKEVVLGMKGELARAKTAMAEQVSSLDERFQGADRARLAALQEAAYYRAKLSAFESSSPSDLAKLERERTASLEAQLADALSAREALSSQLADLQQSVSHHASMRSAADERHAEAAQRASTAESSHAQVLAEFAKLQSRAGEHERQLGEHVDQLAALQASSSVLEGEHARAREQLAEHEASTANWLATLEGASTALGAAQKRNDELSALWDEAKDALEQEQERVVELEKELESLRVERDRATERAEEAERLHISTREAHDASHALATGGLAQLIAAHRNGAGRRAGSRGLRNVGASSPSSGDQVGARDVHDDDDDDLAPEHAARVRAADEQVATLRQQHSQVQDRHAALSAELASAREREAGLLVQLSTLRTQLSTVQAAHTQALDDLGSHKSLVATHEATARDASRARDAASVKAGVLRSLLADHGLAAQAPSEDELASRFPSMTGSESPDQLAKRVLELEGELEVRVRQKAQLEERVREHEGEHGRLREELDRARSGGGEDKERAGKAQEDLEALKVRHENLEATHLKAVQYVKGTEKMLRRMKDELTRHKERADKAEAHCNELESQMGELRSRSEASSQETVALHDRLSALQNEYQVALRQHQDSAQAKVEELSTELDQLDAKLDKANHDLEETLAVNASLNKELQAALKNPALPRAAGGAATSSGDYSRLQAELEQAENQAEWLKRENATLEQRCRSAESKIAILLDHMEGGVQEDEQYSAGGSPHLGGNGSGAHGGGGSATGHSWQKHGGLDGDVGLESDAGSDYGTEQPQRRA
ncbi:uncharacterized protein RHOBADRAFT_56037 [Rhodotorula graminis WP1]|uniref:Uncharacterized protein n=1 Tax=Rhodotorula graminis (strain WP1) TaxID=578459 RepID=A0A0P9EFT7_RHOGW|nr:uncharacterized protein RHOBADRAFT_56037 [Rhodotorula graminis WP1]KPV72220.1 hypothetical protein RHOBADRAFT_56037 [Rhodotorula graminis WP1]